MLNFIEELLFNMIDFFFISVSFLFFLGMDRPSAHKKLY